MGTAKGLLRVGGRPILDYLLDRIDWPGPTLLVTAPGREHPPGWQRFSREAADPVAGMGPLRGLLTALEHAPTERLVVTTVDMPGVEPVQLQWLVDQLGLHADGLGVMLARPADPTPQIEPFPCAFRTEAVGLVRDHLAGGARSVYSLSSKPGVALLPSPPDWPAETWVNLNHPQDLAEFRRSRP